MSYWFSCRWGLSHGDHALHLCLIWKSFQFMHLDLLGFDQQYNRVAGGLGEGTHKTRVMLHLRPLHEGRASGPLATPGAALQRNCKDLVSLCQSIVGRGNKGLACVRGKHAKYTQWTMEYGLSCDMRCQVIYQSRPQTPPTRRGCGDARLIPWALLKFHSLLYHS